MDKIYREDLKILAKDYNLSGVSKMNNQLIPPCSMTSVMKGDDRPAVLPFDINKVPENLRDIVFNYLRRLQYLQLTIMEHVEDERELAEIGEGMSQLEKQFQKLMVEIIPQSDSEAEQSDSEAEQSDSEAEQSDSEAEQSDSEAEQSDSEAEQSDEIRDLKYELALKNKDHELQIVFTRKRNKNIKFKVPINFSSK